MSAHKLLLGALCLTTVLSFAVAAIPTSPLFLRHLNGQDPRIINGTKALLSNTKHQVSIRDRTTDNVKFGDGHICGGSLISENLVLSAAHCFTDQDAEDGSFLPAKNFIVAAGNLNRSQRNSNTTFVFDIKKIIKYNVVFDVNTFADDIVLLVLSSSVPVNHPTVQPIALNDGPVNEGTECQITGWGKTEEDIIPEDLLTADVPIISVENCRKTIYEDNIIEGMLCAGHTDGGRDACQGDSGGPLVCGGIQTGIISWGLDCAKPGQPGIYTDIAHYKDWILSKAAENKVGIPKFAAINSTSGNNNGGVYENGTGNGGNDNGTGNGGNGTGGGGAGGGSMSNFNGSIYLLGFMTIFVAIFSKF